MNNQFQKAFDALEKMGCPVIEGVDSFCINGEDNGAVCWADYYCKFPGGVLDDFGVNNKINAILEKFKLFAEWNNPGMLGVYEN